MDGLGLPTAAALLGNRSEGEHRWSARTRRPPCSPPPLPVASHAGLEGSAAWPVGLERRRAAVVRFGPSREAAAANVVVGVARCSPARPGRNGGRQSSRTPDFVILFCSRSGPHGPVTTAVSLFYRRKVSKPKAENSGAAPKAGAPRTGRADAGSRGCPVDAALAPGRALAVVPSWDPRTPGRPCPRPPGAARHRGAGARAGAGARCRPPSARASG